jgi:hypothetical protein
MAAAPTVGRRIRHQCQCCLHVVGYRTQTDGGANNGIYFSEPDLRFDGMGAMTMQSKQNRNRNNLSESPSRKFRKDYKASVA